MRTKILNVRFDKYVGPKVHKITVSEKNIYMLLKNIKNFKKWVISFMDGPIRENCTRN